MKSRDAEKQTARRLRLSGHSINEIASHFNVSKSSVSLWVHDVTLSPDAQERIFRRVQKGRQRAIQVIQGRIASERIRIAEQAKNLLRQAPSKSSYAKILCALLYWCEGNKNENDGVQFMNSDPNLVQLFLKLLRTHFAVQEKKLRVCLHLHEYHNIKKQLKFWSYLTSIPIHQFTRPHLKAHTGVRIREGYPGCASVRYRDIHFARELHAIAREAMRAL